MHRLKINKLGPIDHCELECAPFMTLTGFQASGKSTIAKAIYYFRTIKDDIVEIAKKRCLRKMPGGFVAEPSAYKAMGQARLLKELADHLQEKFLNIFGSSWGMSPEMRLEYYFTDTCFMAVSLKEEHDIQIPNHIWLTFSHELESFLHRNDNRFSVTPLGVAEEEAESFQAEVNRLFDDDCMAVYVPAGRSMITLLSQQLGYIYAKMDNGQRRSLDGCTRDYLERILRIKPEFSDGLPGMAAQAGGTDSLPLKTIQQSFCLINKILRGSYRYSNGEEQIVLDNGRYVKINFSSSGQQECVWILNLLFYYLLRQKRVLFILEEPESHLFPESQKYMTELIALAGNCGHSIVLTTHSPYVLGTLNNLLYAHAVPNAEKADKIIEESLWLDLGRFRAWFVKDGTIENCMDPEIGMIQNERIDEISKVINEEFDMLLNLQTTDWEDTPCP